MRVGASVAATMMLLGVARGVATRGASMGARAALRPGRTLAARAPRAARADGSPGARVRRLVTVMSTMAEREAAEPGFYITTPIYYVNDKPHIGHAYTTVASDAFARFNRLDGKRVRFLTGTDEHGQKVQQSAEKAGVAPQQFTDRVSANFRSLATLLLATHDDFIRTTEPRHKATVHALWAEMVRNGHIYKGAYEGWYSVRDEAFYAEGELVDGKAPTGAEVAWVSEPSYFFRLSAFTQPLLELYGQRPDFIMPAARRNEMLRFVEGGLQDLSISRTAFSWGIPVPDDEEHVIYVWLDALTNYLTVRRAHGLLARLSGARGEERRGGLDAASVAARAPRPVGRPRLTPRALHRAARRRAGTTLRTSTRCAAARRAADRRPCGRQRCTLWARIFYVSTRSSGRPSSSRAASRSRAASSPMAGGQYRAPKCQSRSGMSSIRSSSLTRTASTRCATSCSPACPSARTATTRATRWSTW